MARQVPMGEAVALRPLVQELAYLASSNVNPSVLLERAHRARRAARAAEGATQKTTTTRRCQPSTTVEVRTSTTRSDAARRSR